MEFRFKDRLIRNTDISSSFNINRIGRTISRGCYKEAYEDESNPAQIFLITDNLDQLNKELNHLKKLQQLGFRTPRIYEKYDFPNWISILVVEKLEHVEVKDVYNKRFDFLTDILFMLEYLWEKEMTVNDLQLMKDSGGRPVFIDPLRIYPMNQFDIDSLNARVLVRSKDNYTNLLEIKLKDVQNGILNRIWDKEYLNNITYRY